MKILVSGVGYIGLPTAIMFAKAGCDVICQDASARRVQEIQAGVLSNVDESELQALLTQPAIRQRLHAQQEIESADVFIIAVGTPITSGKTADLTAVRSATAAIAPHVRAGNLVILESTVPPRTTRDVVGGILADYGLPLGSVDLVHCPERVLPGNIVHEIEHNNRIIGGVTPEAAARAADLYRLFVKGQVCVTDDVTAELCKLMENAFRDVNIALANELADVAGILGVDVHETMRLANMHPRVKFAKPGIGVGGHCIPVDPWFIAEVAPESTRLIQLARSINDDRPSRTARQIKAALESRDAHVVAIGMTFKPNSSDTRGSPANHVVSLLRADGYQVAQYDPLLPGYGYSSLAEIAAGTDCLAILVEHASVMTELESTASTIKGQMRRPVILRF